MMQIQDISTFNAVKEAGLSKYLPKRPRIAVGMGTCGTGNGAEAVYHALADAIDQQGLDISLTRVGCFGYCAVEPLVNIYLPGRPLVILQQVKPADVPMILECVNEKKIPQTLALCRIEEWDHLTARISFGQGHADIPLWNEVPFFKGQKKFVLRNCGLISPEEIEEYIGIGGYQALYKVLIDSNPTATIEMIKASKLRGRGGAGFLTGIKWEFMHKAQADRKYIICNADEGDPGAYMNRNEIEGDPHSLIEGMVIGGYVMGAKEGIVYVRAEYPLAVHRLNKAIAQAKQYGILGDNVLGRGFKFDLHVVEGAGAFVCGEETALIASLEGQAGRPRPRPPFPAQKGLWGRPTNINNVETWYNISPIVMKGPGWFTETGSNKSAGTKVFSLVGKIKNTGLVEMPLGTPLRQFVYDIGEGTGTDKKVKAVQTGGPSGGCIPHSQFDTPVDYETLAQLGAIMGSGGMVVMDDDNCMVDVARYFIEFTHSESCGKCVPCRVGLDQTLRLLNKFTVGQATERDLQTLNELGQMIRETSLCGLGQTAPNPLLTTMNHFRHEYLDHIVEGRCRAGVCSELALSPCENSCPLHMNIPRFLELFKNGKLEDAFESVIMDNPLPASTGRVCQHPCDDRCRRSTMDEAVNMREVHRFIADSVYQSDLFDTMCDKILAKKQPATGRKVAVVGSGPTGLTTAFYLALLGHNVTVYESNPAAGGMLRYALPEYRLPKAVLDREIELIERMGVRFLFNVEVSKTVTLNELDEEFDAVFVSIGTWKEAWVYLPGTELKGVRPALLFLEDVAKEKSTSLGKNVVVIGGGNAAIDSARTALRLGAQVTVVYRRERKDMPAIAEEVDAAQAEGAHFEFLATPNRILGDAQGRVTGIEVARTTLGDYDSSGRRRPVPTGDLVPIPCDTVILAVGEAVDLDFAAASGLRVNENKTVDVDRYTMETSRENFYAGGDVVTGASNVSNAMGSGKRAAMMIDQRLMGKDRFAQLLRTYDYEQQAAPKSPSESHRHHTAELEAEGRAQTFEEVMLGLNSEQAVEETRRCLRCDIKTCATRS